MLKDAPIEVITEKQRAVGRQYGFNPEDLLPVRVREGVYTGGLNCDNHFVEGALHRINDHQSRLASRELSRRREAEGMGWLEYFRLDQPLNGWYGVADNVEQVERHFARLLDDPERAYVIVYTEIRREAQPERDGWRWHKWGPYIGTQESTHEYLYDDAHIDLVIAYHVYAHQSNTPIPDGHPALDIGD